MKSGQDLKAWAQWTRNWLMCWIFGETYQYKSLSFTDVEHLHGRWHVVWSDVQDYVAEVMNKACWKARQTSIAYRLGLRRSRMKDVGIYSWFLPPCDKDQSRITVQSHIMTVSCRYHYLFTRDNIILANARYITILRVQISTFDRKPAQRLNPENGPVFTHFAYLYVSSGRQLYTNSRTLKFIRPPWTTFWRSISTLSKSSNEL